MKRENAAIIIGLVLVLLVLLVVGTCRMLLLTAGAP